VNENQIHSASSNVPGVFIGGYHRTVAIDPGVRTFGTCYDMEGKVVEWGVGDMGRIYRYVKITTASFFPSSQRPP
jgi:hypothetical protein